MHLWTVSLIIIYILTVDFDYSSVNGLQRNVKQNDETKVKCKEVVDEALRQYWDHSKENAIEEEDDDDDSGENNPVSHQRPPDVEQECEEDKDSKEDDNDNDDKDDSEEVEEVVSTNTDTKSKEKESEEEEDDKDDDKNESDISQHNSEELKDSPKQNDERIETNDDKSKEDNNEDDSNEKEDHNKDHKKDNEKDGDNDDDSDETEVEEERRRSRAHIDDVLRVYEIGSQDDISENNLILSIFREMKRLYESSVKPLEMIYKYRHITTRLITDAELLRKQSMVLFLGGKSTGKTSLVNYLLGIDGTQMELNKAGVTTGYPHFTVLNYGENYTRLSPTELSADFTFSSLQQFGQQFLENYIEAYRMPIKLLEKMTIIDSPGLIDPIGGKMASAGQVIDNDVYQWFIDRSDVIYIVIDVTQIQLSTGLKLLIEQLKGRDVRFVLSKTDLVHQQSQIVTIIGQLLWMLSPIMSNERPPQVFALTTVPQDVYDAFIDDQEISWLKDLSNQISGINRVESRIASLRRHAIRVRNHAKLVDCYLSTFYRNKGIFTFGASSRQLASDITENPHQYRVYSGALAGQSQNVSRYDLPDPGVYREFFRSNPLIDFKPLTSTCSYFKGCPIDKLDITIAYQLPELVGKYKKLTRIQPYP